MSLILEALRKSEAQRRLGQAPDLHSPALATSPRGRLPRWLVPAVVLMLVGAAAWWLGRMAVPDPSNGTATDAVVSQTPLPLERDLEPAASVPPVAEAPTPWATPTPDPPPPRSTVEAPPPPLAPAATVAAAPPRTTAAPEPAAPVAARDRPAAPAAAEPPAREPAPVAAAEPAAMAADPAATAAAPAVAAEEGLLRLADLPAATRASLPALRISMHVYAEQPARRFAIIDGRRVGEGGLLEGQGVVEAIRRDGIVVDFDGRRVLLPRP